MISDPALPELIRQRAEESGDRVFLQEVGGEELTWAELHAGAVAWATALRGAGVREGDFVATMMPHSVDAYFAWLGCGWLKAVEVPANLSYRAQWLRHVLNLPRARVLVVSERYLDQVAEVAGDLSSLETVIVFDGAGGAGAGLPFEVVSRDAFFPGRGEAGADALSAPDLSPPGLSPPGLHDLSCVIYTSGTSGPTKGVLVTWAMLQDAVEAAVPRAWGADDVWYGTAPLFHVSGKSCLLVGAHFNSRLVVRETYSTSNFWDDIRRFGCTGAALVGAMVNYLFQQPPSPSDADTPLRYVRMTPLIEELDVFRKRFGVDVYTAYGMTEITPPISYDTTEVEPGHWRSCGKARPGLELRVVDDLDRPLGPGEVGTLVVRADEPWVITPGYVNMPEESLAAWRNGWFHTNDGFMYDEDGYFYFQPNVKRKDMIRRRGENISAFEVEVAVKSHPAVADCKAMAVASEWGEDEVKVVVVPEGGKTIDPAQLVEFLTPLMPKFALPRFVEFAAELGSRSGAGAVGGVGRLGGGGVERAASAGDNVWDREKA